MLKMKVKDCRVFPCVTAKASDSRVVVAQQRYDCQERRLFVVDAKMRPVGIVSVVDINDRLAAKGKDPKKVKAQEIMSSPLNLVVDVNEDVKDVAKKMVERNTYYVPVTETGVLKGVITYNSLLDACAKGVTPKTVAKKGKRK